LGKVHKKHKTEHEKHETICAFCVLYCASCGPFPSRRFAAALLLIVALGVALNPVFAHETLTTTVLFDREIVRILNNHCVMCHAENGPSFPLETYEQTWLQGRKIRADVIARHMPPWPAVPGYGQFANDNNLTLRETQFMVSWVEGLGPRNAGTVFTNVVDPGAARPKAVQAQASFGHWQLGEPGLKRQLDAVTIESGLANQIKRVVIDLGLSSERRVRAIEYMPGDRRVVRAAFFRVQETGQWIGSWTPWYGFTELPSGSSYRLPAGSHAVAEIYYRSAKERVVERGTIGLFFADKPAPGAVLDLILDAKNSSTANRFHAETPVIADTNVVALYPEVTPAVKSVEVSVRTPAGGTEVLLFAKDFAMDWPTPFVFKKTALLRRGSTLSLTAYGGPVKLTVSRY